MTGNPIDADIARLQADVAQLAKDQAAAEVVKPADVSTPGFESWANTPDNTTSISGDWTWFVRGA